MTIPFIFSLYTLKSLISYLSMIYVKIQTIFHI
nr:MAG TPA: hypothetical protein [Caudoviricetes sp.]